MIKQVKKILTKSEKNGKNAMKLNIEENNFYDTEIVQKLNPETLEFLEDDKLKSNPLLGIKYPESKVGHLCVVDETCEIGKETLGMKISK